jgi:WS/DGAT/MGAT family acyltransferase
MSKLTLLDLAFFVAESEASPKHVAGLIICKRPAKSRADFARKLFEEMLSYTDVRAPFNRIIDFSLTSWPHWIEIDEVDLTDHIFYHKLEAKKNTRKDLYELVSNLHVPMLDRSRPLWEVHVIDGLENGRFALYQKIHHAYADGVTLSRWTSKWLSDSPEDTEFRPIWQLDRTRHADEDRHQLRMEILQQLLGDVKGMGMRFLGMGRLAAMMLLESVRLTKNAIALPFVASGNTPLTGQVTSGRQFATTKVTMSRVNAIREVTRSSLNHVALTCLDGALHRYLKDQGIELAHPIMIQMPVNLRAEGDDSKGGNKIGIILVELSPPTDDPYIRLRNIGYSLRNVRAMVNSVSPAAIESYTLVMGMMGQLGEMLQLSDRLPPMGNTLVSNVPGPAKHLYVKGAKMEEMHPMSTLPPSNLLNITLFSYAGDLYFGLIATDELPNLHRLSDYVIEAFDELEATVSEAKIKAK